MADAGSEEPSPSSESAPSSITEPAAIASPSHQTKSKVEILLKATGDAPIMKKRKWAVDKTKRVGWIIGFIRKYINSPAEESLFIYVNQSFAPAPDVEIGTLYDCFGSDGKLVLHYCKSQAWG